MKDITEVDSKKLKDSATKLNASGLLAEKIRTVGVSKQALCEAFVEAIDSLDDEVREQLATSNVEVVEFYNDLIANEAQEAEDELAEATEAPEAPEEPEAVEAPEEPEASAPAPARASRKKAETPAPAPAPKAKAKKTDTPAPPAPPAPKATPAPKAKKAETPTPAPKAKKAEAPAPKKPAEPTTVADAATKAKKKGTFPGQGERTPLGHVMGTMSGTIDLMLIEGATEETVVKKLQKEYGRDYGHALNKFKSHFKYLKRDKGVEFTEVDGVITVKQPKAKKKAN